MSHDLPKSDLITVHSDRQCDKRS